VRVGSGFYVHKMHVTIYVAISNTPLPTRAVSLVITVIEKMILNLLTKLIKKHNNTSKLSEVQSLNFFINFFLTQKYFLKVTFNNKCHKGCLLFDIPPPLMI